MVDLDDLVIYRKLDISDMLGQLYGLPQQCADAWNKALAFKLPPDYHDIDNIVILGMGGSAIGGDLLRSFMSNQAKPLIFVNRDYELPSFINNRTLVIASSYSGNTEETLSAFNQALKKDCKKLVTTTGGKLKDIAETARVPVFPIAHISPPRAALGYSFLPLLAFLCNLGFLDANRINIQGMVANTKKLLEEYQENIPEKTNPAKNIAQNLYGNIAIIYGAGILSEVARRWKTQINENSKAWAFFETLPELNHNSVVGYQFPTELVSKIFVVLLRNPNLNQRIQIRYNVTVELLQAGNIGYRLVDAAGDDDLSLMMSSLYLGDWVSYYLAILYQIDPTPVKSIDQLKERLGSAQGFLI